MKLQSAGWLRTDEDLTIGERKIAEYMYRYLGIMLNNKNDINGCIREEIQQEKPCKFR